MALATLAGATAAAAYLDGKYHLRKDVANLREARKMGQLAQKLAKQNRRSLWYVFEATATELKDEEAIWYRTQPSDPVVTHTWTDVYQSCCRFAQFLLQNGVRPGDLTASYMGNSPEALFNTIGTWAIGCAPAWINSNLAGDGLIHCLKVPKAKILIVEDDEAYRQRIEAERSRIEGELGIKIIILDAATKAAIAALAPTRPSDEYRNGVTGTFPLFLFYTSGTTGFPKACGYPTQAGYGMGSGRARTTGLKMGHNADTLYDCMPYYHGTGGILAIGCMVAGIRLAIGRKFSVRNFWRDIHDSKANCFVYVGETARYLLAAPPSPLDKDHQLKSMYGNGMRPDVFRRFMERFNVPCVNEFFNSTEGMLSLLNVCTSPFYDSCVGHQGGIQRFVSRNTLVPVEVDYEDSDKLWRDPRTGFARRKSYEEGGEIIIRCSSVNDFTGYWNNPEATNKRFERDVFRKGDLYYKTGDALRRDAEGRWFFLDRLGDTFRWRSENVSTADVAEKLSQFPGVVEANVYGVEVPNHDGRAGCAAIYIRPEEREAFDFKGLLGHGRNTLPKYAVPLFLRLVQDQAPMHNNKQNKVPLRKEGIDLRKVADGDAPGDRILWLPPGGDCYVPFTEADWTVVQAGKARL